MFESVLIFFFSCYCFFFFFFFFSSRRRHTRFDCDWSSDVCSSDLLRTGVTREGKIVAHQSRAYYNGGAAGGAKPMPGLRSEERRVGKECRSRWSPYH